MSTTTTTTVATAAAAAATKTTLQDFPPSLNVQINPSRLWHTIHHTAKWSFQAESPTTGVGMTRLSLDESDKQMRQWFVHEASRLGCAIHQDQIGNIFAIRAGTVPGLAPIGMGSHLDTQPSGGRYDGILGVLSALEVISTLQENEIQTRAPIAAVNWTNEEGARFFPGCSGSAVWADWVPLENAYAQSSSSAAKGGCATLGEALIETAQNGPCQSSYTSLPLCVHFELHIEQGPLLEDEGKTVGVVTSITDIRRYSVTVIGARGHAGTVPMEKRRDALMEACRLALELEKLARDVGAFGTVGTMEVEEGSPNVIPGKVQFTVDLRHAEREVLDALENKLRRTMKREGKEEERGWTVEMEKVWHSPAARFDHRAVECIRGAAVRVVGQGQVKLGMSSKAGHDSALTAMRVPTAMIFVPSQDGISHAPEEFTSPKHCAAGAQTLLQTVLEYDARYAKVIAW